jgi:hypothetical protein
VCKRARIYPVVNFIRQKYCCKAVNTVEQQSTNSKQMKEYFITTGIAVAYQGAFDVQVYNILKASKEKVLPDLTLEYYNKYIMQRKLALKKKQEKSLATLVRTVKQKEEQQAA